MQKIAIVTATHSCPHNDFLLQGSINNIKNAGKYEEAKEKKEKGRGGFASKIGPI